MANPLLVIDDLVVDYLGAGGRAQRALAGVSLSIAPGEIVGLCGESGSGKSTLAHAIPGLLPLAARVRRGHVTFDGRDVATLAPGELRRLRGPGVGFVPQSGMNALHPLLTIEDQLVHTLRAHEASGGAAARARARELLTLVDLAPALAARRAHELSGGMRQRVMLALALAHAPRLLVLDEATSALDVLVQRELALRLAALAAERGFAILFVSHDLPLTLALCTRVGVLHEGQLVELAPTARLRAHPAHAYTRTLLGAFLDPRAPAPLDPRAPSTAAPLLSVRGLCKRYGGEAAVDDVSFTVGAGEIVALVGASGAGKSTVARLLAGLERPDAGSIEGVAGLARAERAVQLVLQDPFASLNPARRIAHHLARPLALAARAHGTTEIAAALAEVGLPADFAARFPHQLSGGQRQRVAIARALAAEPALVVADEPTSMLDASLRGEMLALLVHLTRARGRGLLLVTHDLGAARAVADRVLVMAKGRLVEAGPTTEVLGAPAHAATQALLDAIPDPRYGFAQAPTA